MCPPKASVAPSRVRGTEAHEMFYFVCFLIFMNMNLFRTIWKIFLETIPIIVMVSLIPIILNDFILLGLYLTIIAVAFLLKYEKNEWIFFLFGLIIMTVSEYGFINTGVEIFQRNSLFGIMPIWLPFLWAYGFIAIARAGKILNNL